MRGVLISLLAVLSQCEEDDVAATGGMPSGMNHELQDVIYEPQGAHINVVQVVRLRYVQPEIADRGFEAVEADFQYLCDTDGLKYRAKSAPNAAQIIVSISSEPIEFGATAPEVVQFIDAFSVENGACVWGGL